MLVDGRVAGFLERNLPRNLTLKPPGSLQNKDIVLDIIVHALGRVNFGCVWDFKGLVNPDIKLNGDHSYSTLSSFQKPDLWSLLLLLSHLSPKTFFSLSQMDPEISELELEIESLQEFLHKALFGIELESVKETIESGVFSQILQIRIPL